jgi:hypothetical protein
VVNSALLLNDARLEAEGSEIVDWKSTRRFVIPPQTGVQALFEPAETINLDTGLSRHDKTSFAKANDFNYPPKGT